MKVLDSFPVKVLLEPAAAFGDIAAGRTGWGWPLAVYCLATAVSSLTFTLLPPEFIAEAFEGMGPLPDRGLAYNFLVSLPCGAAFAAFCSALISGLARFLAEGRLSLKIPAAGAAVCAAGLAAVYSYGAAGGARAVGLAAAVAAALFAARAALTDRARAAAVLKSMLAVSALALAGALPAGAAALAGSAKGYAYIELAFSFLALYWLAKAVTAVYGSARARSSAAVVLGLFGGLAFLYLAHNLGLIPPEIFQVLMLA